MYREVLPSDAWKLWPPLSTFRYFYLVGGTALALQIGHRVSVDFDLFSTTELSDDLLREVKRVYPSCSVEVLVDRTQELTLLVENIKMTFFHYPFPVLYDFVDLDGVNAAGVDEIAAMKAYTLGRRPAYKDYVDLFFILKERHSSLQKIIEDATRKYGGEFNDRLFLEQLVYLDDVKDTDLVFLKDRVVKENLESFFTNEVKKNIALTENEIVQS